ncbi:ABC transporter ATP-binding protein [Parafrankia discariae]|uniref:ABC transporter ATP-binding protein n=1 Tax=Parafrankia discariae TaxID=365528 RepID=UPI0003818372|nr:ABC transporter ATP-binding protein [Parafrankia discariae]
MTTDEVLVRCEEVSRTFGRGAAAVVAVHGTSCVVRPDDRIAITGPSGSGKSTLLHLMAGLEEPTSGQVSWPGLVGQAASPVSPLRVRVPPHRVGVVFQGASLVPALDVAENTGLPLVLAGLSEQEARGRALTALARVDAAELAGRLPEELSGGQAQRVAVARVLALRPLLVLADEPTGQLDEVTGRQVLDGLLAAASETGAGLVVATHDPAVAARLGNRWTMTDGRLVAAAPSGRDLSGSSGEAP